MNDRVLLPIKASSDRLIKLFVAIAVLLTGPLLGALQAMLYGVSGATNGAFVASLSLALCVDLIRLAPLFLISNRREGILHPIIVTALLWPVALQMPYFVENILASMSGLRGLTLNPPHFAALSASSDSAVWLARAKYDALAILSLLALYLGYFLTWDRGASGRRSQLVGLHDERFRKILLATCIVVIAGLAVFMVFQGGVLSHLGQLSRGRARALEGLGPLVVAFDLGTIAVMLWAAARPQDARNPLFITMLIAMILVQFISNGSRSSAILVVAGTGLVWALTTRRIPTRLAAILLPVAISLIFIFAIVRSAGGYGVSATDALRGVNAETVYARMTEELDGRRYLTGSVPLVANAERFGGPLLGETYVAAVVAPIPRPLWPDKPRGAGSRFAQLAFGAGEQGFAVPIGPVAEAYWNFGVIGVAVLFLLHGALLAKMHSIWRNRIGNPFITVAFALFLMDFSFSTDNIVPWMQKMGALSLIYLASLVFGLTREQRNGGYGLSPGPQPNVAAAAMRARQAPPERC